MPRLHALELVPDDAGEAACRSEWQALRAAGLPSQLDHRGDTNTPHVTVLATATLTGDDEARAVELIAGLLPIRTVTSGLALLGGTSVTLARTLDVDDEVTRAVLALRATTAGHRHAGWLPHVTLARRLRRADLQRAVDVLGHTSIELVLARLRRWDPDLGEVRTLAAARPAPESP